MHILAYIYLLIKRLLPLFAQFYIDGTVRILPVIKPGKKKNITTCKAHLFCHLWSETSRPTSPFRSIFLHQIKYFNPSRYLHCKTDYNWKISKIIRLHLSRLIQSAERPPPVGNIARHPGFQYQLMLVDTSNCLPALFNFLTPHMRFQSSSHTDVPVLKT